MKEMCCPKCFDITTIWSDKSDEVFCRDDGSRMYPFDARCECGAKISSYVSYYTRKVHFKKTFPFICEAFAPEPLSNYCSKCGRPTKEVYKSYLEKWKEEHSMSVPKVFMEGFK